MIFKKILLKMKLFKKIFLKMKLFKMILFKKKLFKKIIFKKIKNSYLINSCNCKKNIIWKK